MSLYIVRSDGSSASAIDCGVACANPETANSDHQHTAGSKTIFMSDDERDAAVGQPLRLQGRGRQDGPALQFVIPSEVEESLDVEFEKNTLLFGADPTPRIVAIELGEIGTVRVYRRGKDGSTIADVEPFHPVVWADSDVLDLGIEAEKLRGDLKYGWLITVDSWKELIALRNGLKNAGRDFFAFTDPVQHYLTATGRTLFKDLALEELKRMQLEVLAVAGV